MSNRYDPPPITRKQTTYLLDLFKRAEETPPKPIHSMTKYEASREIKRLKRGAAPQRSRGGKPYAAGETHRQWPEWTWNGRMFV